MATSLLSTAHRIAGPSCSGTAQHCRPTVHTPRRPHVACAAAGESTTTTATRTLEAPSASGFDSYDSYFANARRPNTAPSAPPASPQRSPTAPTAAQPLPSGPFAVMAPVSRRASGPTPRPVPIVHSSAFLHASDCDDGHTVVEASDVAAARHKSELRRVMEEMEEAQPSGNALQSVLKRVDRSLDELERNPVPIQKAMAEIGRSPAGQATSKGLEAAAKLTISAAREAVKAAVPVGKWALREGVRAGASLLSKAVVEGTKAQLAQSSKSKARQQDGAAKGDKK